MNLDRKCTSCGSETESLLKLGSFPLANQFFVKEIPNQSTYPFTLGRCRKCSLVQNLTPPPLDEIVPHLDWISYNEPEGHVPELVRLALSVEGIDSSSRFLGLTLKEDSTLNALESHGCSQVRTISPSRDFGHFDGRDRPESAVAAINRFSVASYVDKHGESDVLISRQTIEHAPNFCLFLECLSKLVRPNGHFLFEVPDCERNFLLGDYSMLWDEHVSYFTERSLKRALQRQGVELVAFKRVKLLLEDSLVVVARKTKAPALESLVEVEESEVRMVDEFVRKCPVFRLKVQEELARISSSGKKLYLFGASHPAISFLNAMQVEAFFESVIDDNSHKQGYRMAGSGLPIENSSVLNSPGKKVCLLAVNPAYDDGIVRRNKVFCEQGGEFLSIYPGSRYSLQNRVGYERL